MIVEIWEAVAPALLEAIAAVVALMIGWASVYAQRKWGIEIEARHREALHSALTTGARLALDGQLTGKAAVDLAIDYARASVPDAIRALVRDDGVLMRLAESKLRAMM